LIHPGKPLKIVITGPESTGKSELTRELARRFHAPFIPEYAREYVEHLRRPYTFEDLERIAEKHFELDREYSLRGDGIIFFDTYYYITKVWFLVKYGHCPGWFLKKIDEHQVDFFLLCAPDIPWVDDPVRENGGEKRDRLFRYYEREIIAGGYPFVVISGKGEDRVRMAEKAVRRLEVKIK
jgi:NadR type nicotinamide-nucleotide adenylyltransferase